MDLNRYSRTALNAMDYAYSEAEKMNFSYVGSEHILLGISMNGSAAASVLRRFGVTYDVLINHIHAPAKTRRILTDARGLTSNAQRILELALYEAVSEGAPLISDAHMLCAILRERNCMGYGLIALISGENIGEIEEALKKAKEGVCGSQCEDNSDWLCEDKAFHSTKAIESTAKAEPTAEEGLSSRRSKTSSIGAYARDITALAKKGRLDPLIGCDNELNRLIQILCRRLKNNPVLIGEAGVGKTAIVEGLAQKLAAGDCPDELRAARILSLDVASLLAGTRYRGDFEERFKRLLDELGGDENLILFIDEVHTIVGAGAGESGLDAANIMKPMLARGELRVIGATTFDEYKKYIEKDPALERRFLPVIVKEPSESETIRILTGIKEKYEKHHNAVISEDAIRAAVEMSIRYVADRALPDKAIDLMDEAASLAKLSPSDTIADGKLKRQCTALNADAERTEGENSKETERASCAVASHARKQTVVQPVHVAKVISSRLGMPLDFLLEGESERALRLESHLLEKVVGQDEAIGRIAGQLRKSLAGIRTENRPICTLLICSQAANGKTTLALETARALFCDDRAIIRIDLSDYSDEGGVAALIGAPPGYKDSETGGILTEALKHRPYCAVIFDNADRASREVLQLTLKAVEDGHIVNAEKKIISIENTVVIYTAAVDPRHVRTTGFGAVENCRNVDVECFAAVERAFGRKLGGLFDVMVMLKPLNDEQLKRVAALAVGELRSALKKRAIDVSFEQSSIEEISAKALASCPHDARAIKRYVFEKLEGALSESILTGSIDRTKKVICTAMEGSILLFRNEAQEPIYALKACEQQLVEQCADAGSPVFLIAPDKFKGTLSAQEACRIIAGSAKSFFPNCVTMLRPIADGGEGTASILAQSEPSRYCSALVSAPDGRRVLAGYHIMDDGTAVIDMAQAAGHSLLEEYERDPETASTFGVGELILNAADMNCNTIVLCLGGSATNDCGIGAARALGVRFVSSDGKELKTVAEALHSIDKMDVSGLDKRIKDIRFIALCDVNNPLLGETGATAVYGPQKGVTDELYPLFEGFMRNVGSLYNSFAGRDVCAAEGAGAAGGMGAMMLALLDARLEPGAATVLNRIGFDNALNAADLLITGEGRFDASSLKYGKAVGEALRRAEAADKPAVVLAGQVDEACIQLMNPYNAVAVSSIVNSEERSETGQYAKRRLKNAADRVFSLLKQGAEFKS